MTDTTTTSSASTKAAQGLWSRVRPVIAAPARWLKRQYAAARHPGRRREAEARIARLRPVRTVLVMCYGNICRSPYAASVLTRLVSEQGADITVTQGGFFGPNRPANDRGQQVARSRGVELNTHRSRLATDQDATGTDLIVVMEEWQAEKMINELGAPRERLLILGDLDPERVDNRTIVDPYGHDEAFFHRTFDRLDRCLAALVRAVR
jgi:protein-tyrosine-phosphatase